jgi:mannose-6-phosphate isomerase-like protein (cupin superfamily)
MDEKLLEIREFTGSGYQPIIDFGAWRVAILNYIDEIHPAKIETLERHNETDEVFVLEKGRGILFLGEGIGHIDVVHPHVLEPGKIYNVKKGVWHTVILSRDGSVLIVENQNTSKNNSDYCALNQQLKDFILESAKREQPDWR